MQSGIEPSSGSTLLPYDSDRKGRTTYGTAAVAAVMCGRRNEIMYLCAQTRTGSVTITTWRLDWRWNNGSMAFACAGVHAKATTVGQIDNLKNLVLRRKDWRKNKVSCQYTKGWNCLLVGGRRSGATTSRDGRR